MPEGDTIRKIADRLRACLQGQMVTAFVSVDPSLGPCELTGKQISKVESRGKHLLIFFDSDTVLHTHLGREGRWRLRPAPDQQGIHPQTRARIETRQWIAICELAPVAELLTPWSLRHHPTLAALGPDILSDQFDIEEASRRIVSNARICIAESLLDQRLCAGIGNVYKSEALFLEQIDPFLWSEQLSLTACVRLLQTTRKWMRRNLSPGIRRTRWGQHAVKWVYKRAGQHCLKCDDIVKMARIGRQGRSTYFCPTCQQLSCKGAEQH